MMNKKYKNKDGIELSITDNNTSSVLIREVIREACKILITYNGDDKQSMGFALFKARDFLNINFDLQCSKCNRADYTCGCREEIK